MVAERNVRINYGAKMAPGSKATFRTFRKQSMGLQRAANGVARAFGAIAIPVALAVREAHGFQKGMAEVSTLVDTSKVSMKKLSEEVVGLSKATGTGTADLTKGLYQTISAGVDAADAMKVLAVANRAAIAGVSDTASSVDLLTNAINAYGLETKDATRVADIAFQTVKLGKTTYAELASSMGRVMPTAAALKVDIESLYSSIAVLTKTGLATEEAVTRVNAAMMAFLKPTKEMNRLTRRLGYENATAAIKQEGFAKMLGVIKREAGGNEAMLAKLFPRVRAIGSIMALTSEQGAKEFKNILGQVKDSAGAADEAFQKMDSQDFRKLDKALNSLRVSAMQLGEKLLPTVARGFENLSDLAGAAVEQGAGGTLQNAGRWYKRGWLGKAVESTGGWLGNTAQADLSTSLSEVGLANGQEAMLGAIDSFTSVTNTALQGERIRGDRMAAVVSSAVTRGGQQVEDKVVGKMREVQKQQSKFLGSAGGL